MLLRPTTLSDAVGMLADGSGVVVAGGTDVFPTLVDRVAPARMIDVTRLPELKGIGVHPVGYRIGSGCTWTDIVRARLPTGFEGLKAAAREIGSVQIQNRATIGGNLCNASPAADGVAALLALDAEVELTGRTGMRRLPLGEFILGNRKTARRPDEMLTAVLVPGTVAEAGSAFHKLGGRRYLVISIVMVAVNIAADAEGRVRLARIAVGSASAVAQRLHGLEQRLLDKPLAGLAAVGPTTADLAVLSPIDDVRATATYRLEAASIVIGRAIAAAAGAARHAA